MQCFENFGGGQMPQMPPPPLVAHLERGDGLSKLTNYTRGVGYNLLLFPGRITFIYMKYGRQ